MGEASGADCQEVRGRSVSELWRRTTPSPLPTNRYRLSWGHTARHKASHPGSGTMLASYYRTFRFHWLLLLYINEWVTCHDFERCKWSRLKNSSFKPESPEITEPNWHCLNLELLTYTVLHNAWSGCTQNILILYRILPILTLSVSPAFTCSDDFSILL